MRDFILEKGDKATTLKEVKQILRRIDRANVHMKQATDKLSKSKGKDTSKKEKQREDGANMCRLKGRDHPWQDCPNNPILNNFSGKSYTEIPASERYENNVATKAKWMTKEEKEATRNPKSKKAGPEIQHKERIMVAESIPFNYRNKNSTTPQITIKCTDADGKDNKEECPIFADGTQHEVLVQTIKTIFILGNCYDWIEGKEYLYDQNFGRALKGQPSKK